MEQLTVSVSKELLDKAREQAKLQSRSIASIFREALIKYLETK
ncbi:MAG: ribbon-helix-helix protein, CopG family [Peptostreptococcaceae bacterium]|nr:ribbon-helix-helix protein, CopG family [Peptostreptococcaceae bacterium]